ncbi:MAG: DMT family transporter [Candidatus Diapherotrites archaeon]|nr:DMT family transporter [Candidatus Diapherotrites archaeon]
MHCLWGCCDELVNPRSFCYDSLWYPNIIIQVAKGDRFIVVTWITLFMFLTVLALSLILGKTDIMGVKNELPLIILIGVVAGIAYFSFLYGIHIGPVSLVSTIRSLSFIIAVVGGILFFHESLTTTKLFAVILGAISLILLVL